MDDDEARHRFAAAPVARLGTVTADGWPHLVPVVFAVVDDVAYTAVDGKPKSTRQLQRLANVAATGRASLLADEYSEDWSTLWWVRCDGSARVLPGQDGQVGVALDALTRKYRQYGSDPPAGPVIAVQLTRWRSWQASPAG